MEWNQVEFENACVRFRMRYPDFKSFEDPGERYLQEERRYKLELIELYRERVQPHALGGAGEFTSKFIEILDTKLKSFGGAKQNLISHHTVTKLKNLPRDEQVNIGEPLQSVLRHSQTTEDVANALDEYTKDASKVRTSNKKPLSASTMRACVSLLLMLDKPDRFIYLLLSYWQEAGRLLVGNQLINDGVPISKEEFFRCSEFISRVRGALDDGRLGPIDMVDVQSFLYIIVKPAWDQANFDVECEKFKNRYEGFVTFKNPGELYTNNVREFKDELVGIYRKELAPLLDMGGTAFLNKYHEILDRKLESSRPSAWAGWRVHLVEKIPNNKKEQFGNLLQNLLKESVSDKGLVSDSKLSKAFDSYGQESSKLLGKGDRMPSVARIHATLLLMLARPNVFLHAIFKVWNAAGKSLRGEPLIKPNSIVDGKFVISCQELAKDVRADLKHRGFGPRDMIDVQNFLFSIYIADGMSRNTDSISKPSTAEILQSVRNQGMRIEEVTLKRYIHSLDTRGFLILAGPSGTGKTWLTQLYAEAVSAKYQLVPVAPNWAANEDLLGYFNPMQRKFHATIFLEFVDQAAQQWDERGPDAREFHLVLDEMNLARIEHYFSLFLSLMEMRRGNEVAETDLSGGRRVRVSPNLKFIGTVNIDETTHGFADKVFDRAQLLELSIDFESAKEHVEQRLDNRACTAALLELWKAMEPAHPVGFRVLDDIAAYIERSEKDSTHWKTALDQQIVSKLLPKLRGVDPEVAEALRNVRKLVDDEEYPLARDKTETMWRRYEATDVVSYF